MKEAYGLAYREIIYSLKQGGDCLDCGASDGHWYENISKEIYFSKESYHGLEWNEKSISDGHKKGLNIRKSDLNKNRPYEDNKFTCIFALSVLKHLLNGCHFLKECQRALKKIAN